MEEQWWQKAEREKKERKELEKQFPYLGKKVRRKGISSWEEGVVVLRVPTWYETDEHEQFIQFSENDLEQLYGLPFEVWENGKWVKM